ncbi:MAG: hypothetical protein AB1344_01475 [Pseudomonadota bacterium]
MRSILTFASLGLALASTLLLGPQWGITIGLLIFIAGNNALLSREASQLRTQLNKNFNELPDLVNDLVQQRLQELSQAPTSTPPQQLEATTRTEEAEAPAKLEHRLSALDSKFETLVQLLTTREMQEAQPAALTADEPEASSSESNALDQPRQEANVDQAANVESTLPAQTANSPAELAAMRELLEKMAGMLALKGDVAAPGKEAAAIPAEAHQNTGALAKQRPSIDHLRAELDKLALELRSELDRPTV